jgi:hypothetical protein
MWLKSDHTLTTRVIPERMEYAKVINMERKKVPTKLKVREDK